MSGDSKTTSRFSNVDLTATDYLACLVRFLLVFLSVTLSERIETPSVRDFNVTSLVDFERIKQLSTPELQLVKNPGRSDSVEKYLVYLTNAVYQYYMSKNHKI